MSSKKTYTRIKPIADSDNDSDYKPEEESVERKSTRKTKNQKRELSPEESEGSEEGSLRRCEEQNTEHRDGQLVLFFKMFKFNKFILQH